MRLIPKLRRGYRKRAQSATLIEHLEELRYRLVVAMIAVGVAALVGWFLYPTVLHLMQRPYCDSLHTLPAASRPPTGCNFVFTGVIDPVTIKLKVVIFLGLLIALPAVLYQLWAFVVPGLTRRERRLTIPFIASGVLLFALGVLVAYVTLPNALKFLLGFAGTQFTPLLTGDRFLAFMLLLSLAFGLSFEFPIVLIFLCLVGVITTDTLRRVRRYAILGIAIFAAVITPSQDPYTMLGMMIPMVIFYEVAIIVARLLKK
jgi:sec-independent protein translocase protein TatC